MAKTPKSNKTIYPTSVSYDVLDGDNIGLILVTTSTSDRTITLPTAADNNGRILKIKKVDAGKETSSSNGTVIIEGEGAETIDGTLTRVLPNQYDAIELTCNGTSWSITQIPNTSLLYNKAAAGTTLQAAGVQRNIFGATSGNGLTLYPGTWMVTCQANLYATTGLATPVGNGVNMIAISTTEDSGGTDLGTSSTQIGSWLTNAQIQNQKSIFELAFTCKITVTTTTVYYLNGYHGYSGTAGSWYGSMLAKCVG